MQTNKRNTFTTIEFIEEIRNAIGEYICANSYDKVSEFLGMNSRYLWDIVKKIRYPLWKHYNPDYVFSKEVLSRFKKVIIEKIGKRAIKCLELIKMYERRNNDLKDYSNQQYEVRNPHLFSIIKNKNQAYWLGFLMADFYINKITKQIGIELSVKDKNLLKKFCKIIGLDFSRIHERNRTFQYKCEKRTYKLAYLAFGCKPMMNDLIKLGFWDPQHEKKCIFVPNSYNRELLLAWLLGFYDGDGIQDRTQVCSTNRNFLKEIKKIFHIKYEILQVRNSDIFKDLNFKIHERKSFYTLTLGARLFNEMMINYGDSLSRKRKLYSERYEALDDLKKGVKNKKILQNLVFHYSRLEMIDIFNKSGHTFDKLVIEWDIKMPRKGYWKMKRYGNTFEDFKNYFKKNPNVKNVDFYTAFPDRPKSTIRRWKMQIFKEKKD